MDNQPIDYMERTRLYYRAMGYDKDYVWAHFEEVPFQRPRRALSESRVAIVTTAMPHPTRHKGERKVEATPVSPLPEQLYTDHVAWDRDNTHTRDVPSFLPVEQINTLIEEGVVGSLASRFYSVPTDYSQGNTLDVDAPQILSLCREDQADLALLVPL